MRSESNYDTCFNQLWWLQPTTSNKIPLITRDDMTPWRRNGNKHHAMLELHDECLKFNLKSNQVFAMYFLTHQSIHSVSYFDNDWVSESMTIMPHCGSSFTNSSRNFFWKTQFFVVICLIQGSERYVLSNIKIFGVDNDVYDVPQHIQNLL